MRQYTVLEVLGRGGFGKVVRARFDGPRGFTRQVAIKLLLPSSNTERNAEALRRLRDEARLLGLLQHRALVAVDRLAIIDGEWSVVMEYVAGVDGERLIRAGPTPVRPALEIVHEIADVLDYAWHVPGPEGHALRMLHRDIKPGNFLLTADGLVKLLDLGIARAEFAAREALTEDVSFGTPSYMAPERMRGVEVHEGDVYSLGCVLYALLKGEPFGRAGLSMRPHTQHRSERMDALRAARPDVPVEALRLLAELLAFDPEDRPTAGALAARSVALAETLPAPSLRAFAREVVPPLREAQRSKPSAEIGSVLREEPEGAMEVSSGSAAPIARAGSAPPAPVSETGEPAPAAPGPSAVGRPPPPIVLQELEETAPWPGPARIEAPRGAPRGMVIAALVAALSLAMVAWAGSAWLRETPAGRRPLVDPPVAREEGSPVVPAEPPADAEPPTDEREPATAVADPAVARGVTPGSAPASSAGVAASPPPAALAARGGAAVNVRVKGGVPVTLDQQGRQHAIPGVVAPGRYRILATFDGAAEPAGTVTVPPTGQIAITCDASTRMCASAAEP